MLKRIYETALHIYTNCRIFMQARSSKWGRAFDLPLCSGWYFEKPVHEMKHERHNAIRELVGSSLIQNQNDLRRKLRRRGFAVTQATLSRDLHEMHLFKGPGGYGIPNENGNGGGRAVAGEEDDGPPSVADVIDTFGLRS